MIHRFVRELIFGRWLLLAGSIVGATPSVWGQGAVPPNGAAATQDVALPAFDVVSIKQNKSGSGMVRMMTRSDGYSATNVSLKMLLQGAYGIREDLMSGLPNWVESTRYDIDAKVADSDVDALKKLSPEQRRSMLKPVLVDRFKLKVHTETKQLPVYELVVVKGGSKLKDATPGDTYANGIKGPYGTAHAGMRRWGRGQLRGQGLPIASLVNMLSQQLQRTVIDKTSLTGKYDFELQWTEESSDPMFKGSDAGPLRTEQASDASGPSIFTALQA